MERPPRLRVGKPRTTPRIFHGDDRGSAHSRGYGVAWRKVREVVLQHEPLCRHCMQQGQVTAAQEVDHVVPLSEGGTNDRENLQPLCVGCHHAKTFRDMERRKTGGACETTHNGKDHFGPTSARGARNQRREA